MPKLKVRLVGQLIDDNKPTVLAVEDDLAKVDAVAKEYQEVFPDIFLEAEWGYFKKPISKAKAKALANVLGALYAPMSNVMSALSNK